MEPFSITCPTCQTRLKVRDEAAIGQILACPHCQSMVHVQPPSATAQVTNGSATDAAVDTPDVSAGAGSPDDSAAALSDGEAAASPATVSEATVSEMSPTWISPTEQTWQRLVVWGVAGGTGLLLAAGLMGMWWTRMSAAPSAIAVDNTVAHAAATETPLDEGPTGDGEVPVAVDGGTTDGGDGDNIVTDGDATTPAAEPEAEMAGVDDIDVDDPVDAHVSPSDPPIVDEKITDHVNQEVATRISEPVSSEATAPVDAAVPEEQPQTIADEPPESTPAARRHESPDDDHALTETAIIERLETPVAEFDFASVRLVDLVRLVGDLAGVPISIDVSVLERLGIEPVTTVTVRATETTAGRVLQQALVTIGLAHRVVGDQVIVGTRSRDDERRSVKYRVDDLLGAADATAEEFVAQIQRLVAPGSWTASGGRGTVGGDGGTLIVQQTAAVHYEILAFCERLRLARGLALRSKNPRGRFSLAARRALAADRLNRPVTFTFDQPVRLRTVADYLEETTGALVLIDWASLRAANFSPSTLISCAVDQQPLGEALTAVLAPLELGWLAENAHTLRIVSRAEAARRTEVGFYDVSALVASGLDREEIETRVSQAACDGAEATGDQIMLKIVEWDEPSGRMIVRHTQAAHERIGAELAAGQ